MTLDEAIDRADVLAEARNRIRRLECLIAISYAALIECGIAAKQRNSDQVIRSAGKALEEIGPELQQIRSKAHADFVPADWH